MQFGRVEPRGGGWGVLGEYGRMGRFRRIKGVEKRYIGRWPGGERVDRTFTGSNSLLFVGIGLRPTSEMRRKK